MQFFVISLFSVFVALFPVAIAAESTATLEYAGTLGGMAFSVRNNGSFQYVGQGNILRIYSINADKGDPKEIRNVRLSGSVIYLDIYKHFLFALTEQTESNVRSIEILDISNSNQPKIIKPKNFDLGSRMDNKFYFSIYGTILLIGLSKTEIEYIYDITNPMEPVITKDDKRHYELEPKGDDKLLAKIHKCSISRVRVTNHIAYMIDEKGALIAADVSSPRSPRFLSEMKIMAKAKALDCNDRYLAIVDEKNKVHLYSIANAGQATAVSSFSPNENVLDLQIHNQYLCLHLGEENREDTWYIKVFDVNGYTTQTMAGIAWDPKWYQRYRFGFGKLLKYSTYRSKYVVVKNNGSNSFSLYDTTHEEAEPVSQYDKGGGWEWLGIPKANQKYIFLSRQNHTSDDDNYYIDMLGFSAGTISRIASMHLASIPLDYCLQGDIVYIACGSCGLVMLRANEKTQRDSSKEQ